MGDGNSTRQYHFHQLFNYMVAKVKKWKLEKIS